MYSLKNGILAHFLKESLKTFYFYQNRNFLKNIFLRLQKTMGRAKIKIMSFLKQAKPIIIFNQYLITSILLYLTMSTIQKKPRKLNIKKKTIRRQNN